MGMVASTGLYIRYHRWFEPGISLLGLGIDFYSACKLKTSLLIDHGRCQKTQDSQVREEGLYFSWHSKLLKCFHIYTTFLYLQIPWVCCALAHMDVMDTVGLHCRWGPFLELEASATFIVSSNQIFSLGINITLFLKVIGYRSNPEKWPR